MTKPLQGGFGIRRFLAIASTLFAFAAPAALAAPGDLDGSFGNGGVVKTDVDPAMFRDLAKQVFLRSDGRILAAGACDQGGTASFCVAQYNTDGSLDTTFGTGGIATVSFVHPEFGIPYDFELGRAAVLQPDGALVVGGQCWLPGNSNSCVGRILPDGTQDMNFGLNGTAKPDIGINALVMQPNGQVLIVGSCNALCVQRMNADGSMDNSYGTNGRAVPNDPHNWNELKAGALQTDGKLVAAGTCYMPTGMFHFCTVRLNTDGSNDTSFSDDGVVNTHAEPGTYNVLEWANAVAIQPDGKIVVVGRGAVIRYNTDGSYDTGFSDDGIIPYVFGNAVALQQNGRIVAGGGGNGTYTLYRFNADGSPDTTIGVDGVLSIPLENGMRFADEAAIYALAIQRDGRIVAGGTLAVHNDFPNDPWDNEALRLDFGLVRYFGDPTNRAPVCSGVTANISQIDVANHALTQVTLSGANDPDGDALTLTVTGVTQDEPINGLGDGDTAPDAAWGSASNQVYVRGERAGNGDGRVYHIAFTVTDANGATCSGTTMGDGTVRVSVPRGKTATDSGSIYNSFGN